MNLFPHNPDNDIGTCSYFILINSITRASCKYNLLGDLQNKFSHISFEASSIIHQTNSLVPAQLQSYKSIPQCNIPTTFVYRKKVKSTFIIPDDVTQPYDFFKNNFFHLILFLILCEFYFYLLLFLPIFTMK